ncbi:MAG: AMP-binding protein [Blautia sp.]|nr:AMP-binding protein [Blautia sp.]
MKNKSYPLYEVNRPSSVSDMLKTKAEKMPDAVAFRYRKGRDTIEEKTYGDVLKEVKSAASWVEQQFGRGNHIAVIGENSYEWIIAFFAVLTSGNVAVPIDKELPATEVEWLIGKAEAKAAFISKTYSDLVAGIEGIETVTLKKLQTMQGDNAEDYELYEPKDEELACIFFTSGTSGRSKGVMLTHGNLSAELYGPSSMFDPEGTSTFVVLPFHHAFGLNVAVLMAYNYGVTIFLNKSLKKVKDDLLLAKPDVIMLVPLFIEVFYKQIMDNIKKSGREKKVKTGIRLSNMMLKVGIDRRRTIFKEIIDSFGGRLKYIISGGAHLDPFYVKAFRNFGIEILNGYGTTECSPCVALNRNCFKKDGSVGLLIPGMEVRVSDEGEVQLKGPVVMKGYYNDPEVTAEVLQDGWYSTGDLGHVDKDGFIFLTGRKKNLIILSNGENISPEELENDFHEDPAVNEVLVYDKDHKIIAEIYPDEEHMGDTAYFEALAEKINKGRPVYKQIASVKLRDTEFIKNTSKKIVRYKNIPN